MKPALPLPDFINAAWLRAFRTRLRRWHRNCGRELPWRGADPYRVWVSEIMLQQTTVAAVRPYYERFLAALPTVHALADADESLVLHLWEGLGYYSRARNLQRAARIIVADHAGMLPDNVEALQRLPGVGRYTAGAIASFAYGVRAPIVEANTLRLHARLLDFDGDPRSTQGQRLLWRFAESLLPRFAPGEFNQALMDLGAAICTPNDPGCDDCPVMTLCGARQSGREREIPTAASRPDPTHLTECAVAVERRGSYLVRQCLPGERWAGLWDFPRFAVPADTPRSRNANGSAATPTLPHNLHALATAGVRRLTGVETEIVGSLGEMRHSVTRYRIRLICLKARCRRTTSWQTSDALRWAAADELEALPLSTTARRLAGWLSQGGSST